MFIRDASEGYGIVSRLFHWLMAVAILAYATIALAAVHTLAALKHHLIDKSSVMTRMWSGPQKSTRASEKESQQ